MPGSEVLEREVDQNYVVFMEQLEELLREHRAGQFALMRDRSIVGFFDSAGEAVSYGRKVYRDHLFSVQEVREKPFYLGYFSHV